jgi:aminomethyltransferase
LLLKTPLHARHIAAGAKMVNFGGWDMPIDYSGAGLGVIKEHLAVRRAAGLFDVSHMGEVDITGTGALAFLQRVTSNDVAKLQDGHAQYSALPMPSGAPVDDIIVYRFNAERFLLVVNASNRAKDVAWLHAQNPTDCVVNDRSDEFALLALQGPKAAEILQRLTSADLSPWAITSSRRAPSPASPRPSRAPATPARTASRSWFRAPKARRFGMRSWRRDNPTASCPPDSARATRCASRRRCVSTATRSTRTPRSIEAGLGWITCVEPHKGDFNGRAVLAEQKAKGTPRKLVGFEMKERGIARHGYPGGHRRPGGFRPSLPGRWRPSSRRTSASPTFPPRIQRWAPHRHRDPRRRRGRRDREDALL